MGFGQKDLDSIVKEILAPPPKPPVNRSPLVDNLLKIARAKAKWAKGV